MMKFYWNESKEQVVQQIKRQQPFAVHYALKPSQAKPIRKWKS